MVDSGGDNWVNVVKTIDSGVDTMVNMYLYIYMVNMYIYIWLICIYIYIYGL